MHIGAVHLWGIDHHLQSTREIAIEIDETSVKFLFTSVGQSQCARVVVGEAAVLNATCVVTHLCFLDGPRTTQFVTDIGLFAAQG